MWRETPKNDSCQGAFVNAVPQLAPDEPLSPELVLVLPPELRAQVLAGLDLPARPKPRPLAPPAPPLARPAPPPAAEPAAARTEPVARSVAKLVAARFAQLAVIFVAVTILTLVLSLVAQAFR
jgi:hypothetical protein